jgi:exodeoxyribonuclease VII small subunit
MASIPDIQNMTFEAALTELEEIVQQLEAGDLSLDAAILFYERGQALARYCQARLDRAELRVTQLDDHTLE